MKKIFTLVAILFAAISVIFSQSLESRSTRQRDMAGKQIISSTFQSGDEIVIYEALKGLQ